MKARLVTAVVVLAALPLVVIAPRTPTLKSSDGAVLAYGPSGSRSPAREGLSAVVALVDERLPPTTDVITLRHALQRAAERTLGDRAGTLVALDPATGEVLAYASNPDARQPEILSSEPRPPGSTFKIVTAAAALESGRFDPSSKVPCPARLQLQGRTIRTFTGAAPEGLTLTEAFARSCNTAFAHLGLTVGGAKLLEAAESFGLPLKSSNEDEDPHVRTPTSPTEVASLAAGISNVRLTPDALAAIAATVGNGGVLVRPTFVRGPAGSQRALSPRSSEALVGMMEAVVRSGTGVSAAVPGASIAGKTGTVDRELPSGEQVDDAWFVALAPSQEPQLAVAVVLARAGFGRDRAAPLMGRFLRATRGYWDAMYP